MCGIAGWVGWQPEGADAAARLRAMTSEMVHRGPDDEGLWLDGAVGVALGQRRLSILDLSPQGHQPMHARSGRWVVSYNGEIYNFEELRARLEREGAAAAWRGHSDTEVLLACIEAWGLQTALQCLVGMFAIAIWDRQQHTLTLARDRMGEKPLYYGRIGPRLVFASELKPLRALAQATGQTLQIDSNAVAEYMRFGYVPAPRSIYRGIQKLPAGHWMTCTQLEDSGPGPQPYWSLDQPSEDGPAQGQAQALRSRLATVNDTELESELHALLSQAVKRQMVSDVPLGAFLSGGVDSSAVVALMQAQSQQPVRTFTIGFDHEGFDEAPFARAVAKHLGTEHTEMYISAKDALDLIPRLPRIYDEPFADSSQLPTTLVSQLTRRHVTVSLSGDGGDELFAGYSRYPLTTQLWQKVNRMPRMLRRAGASALGALSAGSWDRLLSPLPDATRERLNGRRIHRLAQMLDSRDVCEMYLRLMSQWSPHDRVVRGVEPPQVDPARRHWVAGVAPMQAMRRWDLAQYLPDDLLVKVDRAAMSASLEGRAPLLDHHVVEFAFALPDHALVRGNSSKWLLRQVLFRHVPRELIERPKAGFAVPLASWLRGPLREWAEDLLSPQALPADGMLDGAQIRALWQEHTGGRFDRSSYLWTVLMFQAWSRAVETASPLASRP